MLTFTTLWKHSAPLRDLGITSWEKGFLFSSDNDSCCVRASSTFLHNVLQYKFHIFDIISHVKQQPFCSFVATATFEVIGLYSKINGRILSRCQNYTHVSDWICDKVQHNTVKHQTLPHPKSDEVVIKRKTNKHIFQRVKINPGTMGLELCVPVRRAPKGLAEKRSCLGTAKIKIRFLVHLAGFHFIPTSRQCF